MNTGRDERRSLRKRVPPLLERTGLAWVYRQLILKDGGMLATLRGAVAAAVFAVSANATVSLRDSWDLVVLFVGGAAALTLVVIIGGRRRRQKKETMEKEADRRLPPAPREPPESERVPALYLHLHIEFGLGRGRRDRRKVAPDGSDPGAR